MDRIRHIIEQRLGAPVVALRPVGGGSINATYAMQPASGSALFCKHNSAPKFPQLFGCEAAGLEMISRTGLIRTPRVIDLWENDADQFLLLEWITEGVPDDAFWEGFGRALAALHACTAPKFGAVADNYMGAIRQSNRASGEWASFFLEERICPLLRRGRDSGLLPPATAAALEGLEGRAREAFGQAVPALLHGDLWSGNFICASGGEAVLIDPAVYYGHPAIDLGMTTLFGGFEPRFYAAYNEVAPLPPNYREQWDLANLYPLLIHLLLFGRSYLGPIEETLATYR